MTHPKRSAALTLGVTTGAWAGAVIVAMWLPISIHTARSESELVAQHVQSAATIGARLYSQEGQGRPGLAEDLQVDHLHINTADGLLAHEEGTPLPGSISKLACEEEGPITAREGGERWTVACVRSSGQEVIAAEKPPFANAVQILVLALAWAAIVGILTSLMVLRVLHPLSRISRALDRVGAGERGVKLSRTGLAELDELISRLNNTARTMEAREDAVLQRIKAVQDMARLVAHEVRNPLQSLELLASLVASEEEAEERYLIVGSIHEEIRSLDMVVNRLLQQGAVGSGLNLILNEDDLVPVLHQVIRVRGPEATAHGITLELGELPPSIRVPMDQALLGRSIENLVLNAMQYVPPTDGKVRLWAGIAEGFVEIGVEDNGPGVDPELAPHIFDANVSGRTGGTGLGLALVKGVIQAHGGTIEVYRSSLGGAGFTLRIPFTAREIHGRQEPESPGRR